MASARRPASPIPRPSTLPSRTAGAATPRPTSTTALTFAATGTSGENLAAIISIAPAAAGAAAFTQPGTAARTPARARKGGSQGSTGAPVIPPVPAQFTGPHTASGGRIAGTGYSSGSGGAPAPGGSGSISVVNITKSNSLTPTIPSTTAGNCLLVLIASKGSSGSAASVSGITLGGSAGNFASLAAAHGTDGFTDWADAFAWADPSCAGGQTAVSISGSNLGVGSGIGGVTVLEISGIAASSPLDKSSTGNGQSSSFASGATATTTVAAELWAAIAATPGSATGPGLPWTDESPPGGAAAAAYQVVSSTGTASYSGTCSNEAWAALVVTLKGGSTAAAPFTGITATLRGRRAATGSSAGSPGAVVIAGGPVTPAHVPAAARAVRGRQAAAHRPGSGSPGAPVTAPGPVTPATFTGPHCAVRGRQAAAHRTGSGSPGAPVTIPPPPAPFPQPHAAVRGRQARLRGTARGSAGAPVTRATRTLLIALASKTGTDDYGNAFPQGVQVGSPAGISRVTINPSTGPGFASAVEFPMPAPALASPPNVAAGAASGAALLEVSGPELAAAGDRDWVQLSCGATTARATRRGWSSARSTPSATRRSQLRWTRARGHSMSPSP